MDYIWLQFQAQDPLWPCLVKRVRDGTAVLNFGSVNVTKHSRVTPQSEEDRVEIINPRSVHCEKVTV